MANHFGIISLGLLHIFIIMTACQQATPSSSCTCKVEKRGMFKQCKNKDAAEVWRKHYYTDIGLYGNCLPHVEENTMRCYRWRIADNCGPENTVKCSLRHRDNLYASLTTLNTDSHLSQAILLSPGFDRKTPRYYNKNFCIYNISLDCPEEMVELVPTASTTRLSDTEPCRDYLSFHVDSQRKPLIELCGAAVKDTLAYRTIPSTSFSAILWSDDDEMDQGRFEILARCKAPEQGQGSGAGRLTK